MSIDPFGAYSLLADYGSLIDAAKYDDWLGLFAEHCRYQIVPRENYDRGFPAALVFCDSRGMLEDRIRALREANKFNIHTDRHVIGLPRLHAEADRVAVEAPFAVFQTDQEGETRLFATGLYRDRLEPVQGHLKIRDKLVLLDTFAVPSLLATPL
jgi:anthranilate 1,2-dioxygenase small subunit